MLSSRKNECETTVRNNVVGEGPNQEYCTHFELRFGRSFAGAKIRGVEKARQFSVAYEPIPVTVQSNASSQLSYAFSQ